VEQSQRISWFTGETLMHLVSISKDKSWLDIV
jgi:hypothetical protein